MVKLIDFNPQYHALLLEQAIPGQSLHTLYPHQVEATMTHYVHVIEQLCSVALPDKHDFRHIRDWLGALDRADKTKIPAYLLDKAIKLRESLFKTPQPEFVLHGDLHHDNILQHGDNWLAIDPQGIIGETAFEAAWFNFIDEMEFDDELDIPALFQYRVQLLAKKLNLDLQRLIDWVFVRLVLSACWTIEDNGNVEKTIERIEKIFPS